MPSETVDFFCTTEQFTHSYLPETYFAETGTFNISGVVHVQADWQVKIPTDFAAETAWLDALARPPLAIVGEARLHEVASLDAALNAHRSASPRFRGIRDMLAYHPAKTIHNFGLRGDMMQTTDFRQGFTELGKQGLTFDAFIYANQLDDLSDLVEAVPTTRVVVDHMATPIGMMGAYGGFGTTSAERQESRAAWQAGLTRLAQSEQVAIKLSGLFMPILGWDHGAWGGTLTVDQVVEMIGPDIQFVLDTFSPHRCMFASNFPPDRVLMQFETLYAAYFQIVKSLDMEDQKALFGGNARRFYAIAE